MTFTKNNRGQYRDDSEQYTIFKQEDGLWHAYHNGNFQDTGTLTNAKILCENHKNGDALLFQRG